MECNPILIFNDGEEANDVTSQVCFVESLEHKMVLMDGRGFFMK